MADTRQIFYGDPFLSEERQKERVEGLTDSYLSNIMALPMEVLALMAPDAGYTPGELRSSPQDRLKGEMLAWELHQQGRSESPDYAKGADLGTDLSYVADPFFDIPGVAAARLGKAAVAAKDIPKRGKQLRNKLADEAGLFTLYQGEPSALKGQFSALHDRVPRLEIDDSASNFFGPETIRRRAADFQRSKGRGEEAAQAASAGALDNLFLPEVLEHDELYRQSPDLQRIKVEFSDAPGGAFSPADGGTIRIGAGEGRGTALHEIQHALQERGGMARGGSPKEYASGPMFDSRAKELTADLSQSLTGGVSAKPTEIKEALRFGDTDELAAIAQRHGFNSVDEAISFLDYQDWKRTPFGQYQRMAGEIEARDAAARRNLTAEERRRTQPYSSEDIPLSDFIVRQGE